MCTNNIRLEDQDSISLDFSMCFDAHSLEKIMACPKASVPVMDYSQHYLASLDPRYLLFAKYIDWDGCQRDCEADPTEYTIDDKWSSRGCPIVDELAESVKYNILE